MEYRSDAIGILYAEEFGQDRRPSAPKPAPPPPPPGPPPISQESVDAACIQAVAAAQRAWAQADEARRVVALETLAAGLAELRTEALRQCEAVAEALSGTALAAITALLPAFADRFSGPEIRALAATLLPPLASAGPVTVRVHPSLIAALQAELDLLDDAVAGRVELRPANLPPGDARFDWSDGSLTRDTGAIRRAIAEGFAQLGLLPADADEIPADMKELELAQ